MVKRYEVTTAINGVEEVAMFAIAQLNRTAALSDTLSLDCRHTG